MSKIMFKPKQVTKKLLSALPERARDVLIKRYGLGSDTKTQTLEAIGQIYGITRERVRQIENHALQAIQKSDVYKEQSDVFNELRKVMVELGNIITEAELLEILGKDKSIKNHLFFLLVLGEFFVRKKEDATFNHRWYVEPAIAKKIEKALEQLHSSMTEDDLVSENEMIAMFMKHFADADMAKNYDSTVPRRWLTISKVIAQNPLGEWGMATSPNVRAKGIRDFAYLAVKRHGSPMHFKEVACVIEELFGRKAHVATCHNELIKDERFVLVGRGLYALTEWGYSAGVVKDVLQEILKINGPLTREEIIDKVRKERYVKDNTIVVNLQDTSLFKKLGNGGYTLVE